jgi:hypothetical protein
MYGGKEKCKLRFYLGNCRRDHVKDLGIDGRIILKWDLEKWDVKMLTGLIELAQNVVHIVCMFPFLPSLFPYA